MNRWMSISTAALVNVPHQNERSIGQHGVARMDREHAVLAALIERFGDVCAIENATRCLACILTVRDHCEAGVGSLIAALIGYMRDHFRYEERLMDGLMPQDYVDDHKADHARIEARILGVTADFERDRNAAVVSRLLTAELRDWLSNHTETHDAILASYAINEERP